MKGTISLFGFPSTDAKLEVIPRSTAWRGVRVVGSLAAGLLLAPALGLVPPHAPWAILSLTTGGFVAFRKWQEQFTVVGFQGECPRCGGPLAIRTGTPLRPEMTLPCPGCNHDSRLTAGIPTHTSDSGGLP